jgi:hypothetical protein
MAIDTKEEAERFLPRMGQSEFKRELYIVESDVPGSVGLAMLDLDSWKVAGWAFSKEISAGAVWRYVCMFENESGLRYWNQVPTAVFIRLANLTESKAASRS